MPKLLSLPLILVFSTIWATKSYGYNQLDSLTDTLLQEVMSRMSSGRQLASEFDFPALDDYSSISSSSAQHSAHQQRTPHRLNNVNERVSKQLGRSHAFGPRHDSILGREPSIRDQEYLEHSSLFGHQYVQGGAGEGYQHLKPDGSMKNMQVVKTDGVLPAYCNPPNPCPLGYTAEDGCLTDFVNTAAFSQEYQAAQECMCDNEHMFDCPGATRDNEIDALARSIQNEGMMDSTLDRLVVNMKSGNPFLDGDELPVVAKKAPNV